MIALGGSVMVSTVPVDVNAQLTCKLVIKKANARQR